MLLNYVFPISAIDPVPAVATGFLKRVLAVVKPNSATEDTIVTCTTSAQIAAITDNTEAVELLNAGMTSVYVLPTSSLDIATIIEPNRNDFFTILIGSEFTDGEKVPFVAGTKSKIKIQDIMYEAKVAGVDGDLINIIYEDALGKNDGSATVSVDDNDITVDIEDGVTTAATIKAAIEADSDANALISATVDAGDDARAQAAFAEAVFLEGGVDDSGGTLNVGTFEGVLGLSSDDQEVAGTFAAMPSVCGFYAPTNAKNMFYAFGKLLSNALNWTNQQYISMPVDDGIDDLGVAELLFDDKVSFVLTDDQYLTRLALFACGGQAIVAPYIIKNLKIELQGNALRYIAANQPAYTVKNASLLENSQQSVIELFISRNWIENGIIEIKIEQNNFVASGYINVTEPKALWRIYGELRQTL